MAALVEQSHDENGIIWPAAIAPYDVHVVVLAGAEEIGEQAAEALSDAGQDVLLDDRDQRPGEKFADADLIGDPDPRHRGQEEPRGRRRRRPATAAPGRSGV